MTCLLHAAKSIPPNPDIASSSVVEPVALVSYTGGVGRLQEHTHNGFNALSAGACYGSGQAQGPQRHRGRGSKWLLLLLLLHCDLQGLPQTADAVALHLDAWAAAHF